MNILNQRFNLKKVRPKTQRDGDVGWMVDCEIAELTKFANLGHYPPNIPTPLVLVGGVYGQEKAFRQKKQKIFKENSMSESQKYRSQEKGSKR